jgi:chorismate mutase/prephenate dehydratase
MSDPTPQQPHSPADLDALRDRIDDVDSRLVQLLNERANLVVDVGKVKQNTGTPIYAPHREQAVLKKVLNASAGPLPPRAVEAVYRELMSGSFALEHPLRIGYLGPRGSFSHQAATKHFGSSVSFEDMHEIAGVFTEVVRGHCHYGMVPIENSTGGGVVETLDSFREHGEKLSIYSEVLISINHSLLANCEPREVKRIHSKPEVFSQCRRWLSIQFPGAELVPAASTARAVQTAKAEALLEPDRGAAAIASVLAGQIYGVNTIFEDIEDDPNNITRFCIIAKQQAQPTGDDKTSVMFTTEDKPGALVSVLQVLDRRKINLSHLDKRPSGRVNWQYTFFMDLDGHRDTDSVSDAIEEARTHCKDLTVLGSYPRATRIL